MATKYENRAVKNDFSFILSYFFFSLASPRIVCKFQFGFLLYIWFFFFEKHLKHFWHINERIENRPRLLLRAAHTTTHFNSNRNEMKMNYPSGNYSLGIQQQQQTDWRTDRLRDWWTDRRTCQRAHLGPHANCKSQISFCFEKICTQLIKWSTHSTDTDTCGCQIHLQFTVYSTLKLPLLAKKFTQSERKEKTICVVTRNQEIATSLRNLR